MAEPSNRQRLAIGLKPYSHKNSPLSYFAAIVSGTLDIVRLPCRSWGQLQSSKLASNLSAAYALSAKRAESAPACCLLNCNSANSAHGMNRIVLLA
jgi:hypothetical protein